MLVLGDVPGLTAAISASLIADDYRVRHIVPGPVTRQIAGNRYEADFSSPDALRSLHQMMVGREGDVVGGLINFLGISDPFCEVGCDDAATAERIVSWQFNVSKEFAEDLKISAEQFGGWVLNLTALDGKFGLGNTTGLQLANAGSLGLFKSFAREYPDLRVKNVDIDPKAEPQMLASRLLEEMTSGDDRLEVGLNQQGRWRLNLKHEPQQPVNPLPVDSDSVILITGGAYGITADATRELARTAHPTLVIVGRSPLPEEEGPETRDLDEKALRAYFIDAARKSGKPLVPAEIERSFQRSLKQRKICQSLKEFSDLGARVDYRAVDVRSPEQFGGLIDEIYDKYGRLDGVLHGAGIIDDKLIRDKTLESFLNVFGTKVESAVTLANKLRPENLKFLVFFSSVSGRFGNAGQSDYSAANEFLNKLAVHLDAKWPGRVVSINWGPWDAGMMSGELRRLYESKGLYLIPVPEGVRFLTEELQLNGQGCPEVVISCSVEKMIQGG